MPEQSRTLSGAMIRRALTVIVALTLGGLVAPLTAGAQPAPKAPRIGVLCLGTSGTVAAIAAVTRQTQTIPIVMAASSDPVGTGFVANLAHPGWTVTGLGSICPELSGKKLELLKEAVPGLSRVAIMWNPDATADQAGMPPVTPR